MSLTRVLWHYDTAASLREINWTTFVGPNHGTHDDDGHSFSCDPYTTASHFAVAGSSVLGPNHTIHSGGCKFVCGNITKLELAQTKQVRLIHAA